MVSVFADKETQSGETKMVGTHIQKSDADRLAMISLEKGTSRAAILKELIEKYLEHEVSLPSMIDSAVNRAVTHWEDDIAPNTHSVGFDKRCNQYMQDIQTDLRSKRIEPNLIKMITTQIRKRLNEA